MWFKSLLLVLIGYWIYKRVFRVVDAVKQDGNPQQSKTTTIRKKSNKRPKLDHSDGGDYVDYEEIK
jgi:hypothetical protein